MYQVEQVTSVIATTVCKFIQKLTIKIDFNRFGTKQTFL